MATMTSFPPTQNHHNLPLCPIPSDLFDLWDNASGALNVSDVPTIIHFLEAGTTEWSADLPDLRELIPSMDSCFPGQPPTASAPQVTGELVTLTPVTESLVRQTDQPLQTVKTIGNNELDKPSDNEVNSVDITEEPITDESPLPNSDPNQLKQEGFVTKEESNDRENCGSESDTPPDHHVRRCQTRYSLRPQLNPSSHKQSRPTVRKTVVLWKFLQELLEKNDSNCIEWVSKEEGIFKFTDSKLAARLWGQRKNKRHMTYEKLSRALRYYYDRKIMYHDKTQKLIYRFGEAIMNDDGLKRDSDGSS